MRSGLLRPSQLIILGTITLIPTMILFLPGGLIREAGRWAWLSVFVTGGVVLVLLALTARSTDLYRYGLIRGCFRAFGPWLGRIPLVLFWGTLVYYSTTVLQELSRAVLGLYIYGDVPIAILSSMIILLTTFMGYLGIETIAYIAPIFMVLMMTAYIILIAIGLPFMNVHQLLPLWPQDTRFLRGDPLLLIGFFLVELSFLYVWSDLLPEDTNGRTWLVVMAVPALIAIPVLALSVIALIVFWGPQRAAELELPLLSMGKNIIYGDFFRSLDALLLPSLMMAATTKLAVLQSSMARVSREILPIGSQSFHVFITGWVLTEASVWAFPDSWALQRALHFGSFSAAPLLFGIPVLVAVALKLRSLTPANR